MNLRPDLLIFSDCSGVQRGHLQRFGQGEQQRGAWIQAWPADG
jgi:hypothetical protein